MSFKEKVVIVTGAGFGLGRQIALHFAKNEAILSLIDINATALNETEQMCKNLHQSNVLAMAGDVSKDEDVARVVDDTLARFGKIDVLVNCAGIYRQGSIQDVDLIECLDRVLAVNLRAVAAFTHRAAPALLATRGCIVNITSCSAQMVADNTLPYLVSKAAVTHFTKCVALELASKGVRVNAVLPGPMRTNIMVDFGLSQKQSDVVWDAYVENTPLRKLVSTERVAELVGYLAGERAAEVTGVTYLIDAGMTLSCGSTDLESADGC